MTVHCAIKRHDGPQSIEHIIPEAIGGMLTTPHVCETCNNNECAKLDAVLTDDPFILMQRFRYKTAGWENVKDKVLGRGKLDDGTVVVVRFNEASGIFKPSVIGKETTVKEHGDGTATETFTFGKLPTPEELLKKANRVYRRRNEPEITLDELPQRITVTAVEHVNPTVHHEFRSDLVGLHLAGLKIAYEFAVDTLGEGYLDDPWAEMARNLIVAGVPDSDDPVRETFEALGGLRFKGLWPRFPWREPSPPGNFHLLGMKREGHELLVVMRIFDLYEGGYTLSRTAERLGVPEGPIRTHWVDIVAKKCGETRPQVPV